MAEKMYIVVGDGYSAFAANDHVLCVSDFINRLQDGEIFFGDEHVVIGQGIGESSYHKLKAALEDADILNVQYPDVLAPVQMTHKRHGDNVLITIPQRLAPRRYLFHLAINNLEDRLSDHNTGQHVGAMLLMEAARQAVIVTLGCEYPPPPGGNWGFILDQFNSQFHSYLFPLPTPISVVLEETQNNVGKQIDTILKVKFSQSGNEVCEMQLDVKLYHTSVLEKIESRRARQAIEQYRDKHGVHFPGLSRSA